MRDDPRYTPTVSFWDGQVEMEYQERLSSFFPTETGSPPSDFFSSGYDEAAWNNDEMYQRLPEEVRLLRAMLA